MSKNFARRWGVEVFRAATARGALLMALVALPSAATAQMAALDPYVMRPRLDGDPRHPPRFSRQVIVVSGRGAGATGRFQLVAP